MESHLKETKDLRNPRLKGGKPSNDERSSTAVVKKEAKITAAELIRSLRKDLKDGVMTPTEKMNLLKIYLPIVVDDDHQDLDDLTFDTLSDKYLRIDLHIRSCQKKQDAKEEDNE